MDNPFNALNELSHEERGRAICYCIAMMPPAKTAESLRKVRAKANALQVHETYDKLGAPCGVFRIGRAVGKAMVNWLDTL